MYKAFHCFSDRIPTLLITKNGDDIDHLFNIAPIFYITLLFCKNSFFNTFHIRSLGQFPEALWTGIVTKLLNYLHQIITAVSIFINAGCITVQFDIFVLRLCSPEVLVQTDCLAIFLYSSST